MTKKGYFFLLILTLAFTYGCTPQTSQVTAVTSAVNGEQALVLQTYLTDIEHGKFTDAYQLLATENRKQINQEDFVTYYSLGSQLQKITGFKIESSSELPKSTEQTVQNQDAYIFRISETYQTVADKKTNTASGQLQVVNDNGNWKVLWGIDKTIKQMISQNYANLAWNLGPDKSTETLKDFNQAIKYDPNNGQAYLGLSVLELQLKAYDKTITYANQGLAKTQVSAGKSQFHSVMGQAYLDQTDLVNANNYFTLALQEDPNNANAKQGLDDINKQK